MNENLEHGQRIIYAGFLRRFLAYIIDTIILSVASIFWLTPLMIYWAPSFLNLPNDEGTIKSVSFVYQNDVPAFNLMMQMYYLFMLVSLISMLITWFYYSLMESSAKQATVGKMIVGIKVTDMNLEKITFARASGRYFAKLLSTLILMIGYIMAAFTKRKQALHDILAETLVVDSESAVYGQNAERII